MTVRFKSWSLLLILSLAASGVAVPGLWRPAGAETRVGGVLKGETHWTKARSPYVVTEDLMIPPGATLTLDPGVVVRFKPNVADARGLQPFDLELAVRGTIRATGADGDSVYFTSDAVDVARGDWWGIIVPDAGGKIFFDRVVVEFGNEGIGVTDGEINIIRSQVRSCAQSGVQLQRGHGQITRTLVTDIGNYSGMGRGVYLLQTSDIVFDRNLIIGNQTGLVMEQNSKARITNSLFSLCKNYGVVYGDSGGELIGNNVTQNEYGLFLFGNSIPKVRDNNIFNNGTLNVKVAEYNRPPDGKNLVIDLTGNWWGDITNDAAAERISDGYDDAELPAVCKIEPTRKEAWRSRD